MNPAAPASPAPSASACIFAHDLHPDLADAREIHQVRDRRPLSGEAIGFLRFRSELRRANAGISGIKAENHLKSLGTKSCQGPVSILARLEFQCAWIVGAEGGIATCCGAPVLTGTSWCASHRAKVFPKGGAA